MSGNGYTEKVKELFSGTYDEFLIKYNTLVTEVREYKMRKAIDQYMFSLMVDKRPYKCQFDKIFKDTMNKNGVMDIDKANDIYLKTFKRRY